MIERIEKIEEELNLIRYNFEFTKQYIENEKEKTKALTGFSNSMIEFVKDVNEKILDLQDSFVSISKGKALHFQLIELQGRSIKDLREIVENHQKILKSI